MRMKNRAGECVFKQMTNPEITGFQMQGWADTKKAHHSLRLMGFQKYHITLRLYDLQVLLRL